METASITLNQPLKRSAGDIAQLTLHKPNSGALRGVSLQECVMMNTDAICVVIPRISDPKLTPQEMAMLDPSDLLQLGAALANFLLPPSLTAEAAANLNSNSLPG